MKALLGLFVAQCFLQSIDCAAIFSLELVQYSNPRGSTAFGRRCDLWPGGRELPCDPLFSICVSPQAFNQKGCIWTTAWMNRNEIKFHPGMLLARGIKNPILYKITSGWTGQLTIDITAKDEDGVFDDQLDVFRKKIRLGSEAGDRNILLKGETSTLSMTIRSLCIDQPGKNDCLEDCLPTMNSEANRWVCRSAGPLCVPRDDNLGHYECDEISGKKKCLPGWTGERTNCLNDVRTDISCSTNYMRIDIDRKYFDPEKYFTDISLLDKSCKATISTTHITLDTQPQSCGAIKTETKDHIVYMNEVYMRARPTQQLVTREHDVRIKFKCSYKKSDITGLTSFMPLTSIDVQDDAAFLYTRPNELRFSYGKKGHSALTFNLQMYKDKSFKQIQKRFPIEVKLNESMYFEVNSTSNDEDLVLLIDQCYATPSMDYVDKQKYTFINNGCSKDKTLTLFRGDRKSQRFSINTFAFVRRSRSVFMHCILFMCRKSSVESKCMQECNRDRLRRAKREAGEMPKEKLQEQSQNSKYYLLDIGPIKTHNIDVGDKTRSKKGGAPVVTIMLIVGIAVLVSIAAALFAWMRRSNRDDTNKPAEAANLNEQ